MGSTLARIIRLLPIAVLAASSGVFAQGAKNYPTNRCA